jgi:hypothetical protein
LRGGCELQAVSHYLKLNTEKIVEETNFSLGQLFVRRDSTSSILLAATKNEGQVSKELSILGLKGFSDTRFFDECSEGTTLIFSPWCDAHGPCYRHRQFGFGLTFNIPYFADLTRVSRKELETAFNAKNVGADEMSRLVAVVDHLKDNYEYSRVTNENELKANLRKILALIPQGSRLILILPSENKPEGNCLIQIKRFAEYKSWISSEASKHCNASRVEIIDIDDFIHGPSDFQENLPSHFDRMVYFRLYEAIIGRLSKPLPQLAEQSLPS